MRTKAASALQVFANHPSPPGGADGASACQTTRTVRKGHHPYRKDVTLHRSETRTGRTLAHICQLTSPGAPRRREHKQDR